MSKPKRKRKAKQKSIKTTKKYLEELGKENVRLERENEMLRKFSEFADKNN